MSISLTEIIVVCVVALLLFGPEQLPVLARTFGKIAGDVKRTSDSLRREFYNSVYTPAEDIRRDLDAEGRALRALKAEVLAPPPGTTPAQVRPKPQASTDPASPTPKGDETKVGNA